MLQEPLGLHYPWPLVACHALIVIILSLLKFYSIGFHDTVYCISLAYLSLCYFLFFYLLCWSSKSCFPNVCASGQSLALSFSLNTYCLHAVSNATKMCMTPEIFSQALIFLQGHFTFKSWLGISTCLFHPNSIHLEISSLPLLFFMWSDFSSDWIISVNKLFSQLHSCEASGSPLTSFSVSLLHPVSYQVLSVLPSQLVSYSLYVLFPTATTIPYYFTPCLLCWSFCLLYFFLLNYLNKSPSSSF